MAGRAVGVHDGAVGELVDERDSAIYVSMTDPIGRPSFKPSPTKPIPRWMRPFDGRGPDQIDEGLMELVRQHRTQKRLEAGDESRSEESEASTVRPTPLSPAKKDALQQDDGPRQTTGTSQINVQPSKLASSVTLERIDAGDHLSPSTIATYHTPPEYPSSVRTSVDAPSKNVSVETETPRTLPPSVNRSRSQSVRAPATIVRGKGTQNPLWRLGKTNQRRLDVVPRIYRAPSSITARPSSEFRERLQLGGTASTSGPSTPRTSESRSLRRDGVPRTTIVGRLRKNSRLETNIDRTLEEAADGVSDERSRRRSNTADVTDMGQNQGRRRSVHAELRKLFRR